MTESNGMVMSKDKKRGRTIDTHNLHRLGFLVHAHRTDLGGKGRCRSPGKKDCGYQHAKLSQDRYADQFHDQFRCPQLFQQIASNQGDHRPDKERHDGNQRQGFESGFLD